MGSGFSWQWVVWMLYLKQWDCPRKLISFTRYYAAVEQNKASLVLESWAFKSYKDVVLNLLCEKVWDVR